MAQARQAARGPRKAGEPADPGGVIVADERLRALEALERVVTRVVIPAARTGRNDAAQERVWKFPNALSPAELERLMGATAMWEDPPSTWSREQLVTWSKGYLYGRELAATNLRQLFERILTALRDPAHYYDRWRVALLEMVSGSPCEKPDCDGLYQVDATRVGLVCSSCQAFHDFDAIASLDGEVD